MELIISCCSSKLNFEAIFSTRQRTQSRELNTIDRAKVLKLRKTGVDILGFEKTRDSDWFYLIFLDRGVRAVRLPLVSVSRRDLRGRLRLFSHFRFRLWGLLLRRFRFGRFRFLLWGCCLLLGGGRCSHRGGWGHSGGFFFLRGRLDEAFFWVIEGSFFVLEFIIGFGCFE